MKKKATPKTAKSEAKKPSTKKKAVTGKKASKRSGTLIGDPPMRDVPTAIDAIDIDFLSSAKGLRETKHKFRVTIKTSFVLRGVNNFDFFSFAAYVGGKWYEASRIGSELTVTVPRLKKQRRFEEIVITILTKKTVRP